jgi:hypothetical protein
MHQDQMEVVRDELARLDQLEEEQKALRAELARDTPPRSPRVALRLVSGETAPSPPLGERPGPSAAPSPGGPAAGEVAPSLSSPQAGGGISSPADPDPHARLSRRLAEIRDERHGLWKRLLGSLSGDGADRSLP